MTSSTTFRLAAIAEACSWTGLLFGMLFKHVLDRGELGVQIFGPIHGAMFVAYLLAALHTSRAKRWSAAVTGMALLAAVPPLTTVVFERWATARGLLTART